MVFEELCTEVKRVLTVELRVFVDNRHLMTGDGYGPGCSGTGPCYKEAKAEGVREVEQKDVPQTVKPANKVKQRSAYDDAGHAEVQAQGSGKLVTFLQSEKLMLVS